MWVFFVWVGLLCLFMIAGLVFIVVVVIVFFLFCLCFHVCLGFNALRWVGFVFKLLQVVWLVFIVGLYLALMCLLGYYFDFGLLVVLSLFVIYVCGWLGWVLGCWLCWFLVFSVALVCLLLCLVLSILSCFSFSFCFVIYCLLWLVCYSEMFVGDLICWWSVIICFARVVGSFLISVRFWVFICGIGYWLILRGVLL